MIFDSIYEEGLWTLEDLMGGVLWCRSIVGTSSLSIDGLVNLTKVNEFGSFVGVVVVSVGVLTKINSSSINSIGHFYR